jgi:hypothetical protein
VNHRRFAAVIALTAGTAASSTLAILPPLVNGQHRGFHHDSRGCGLRRGRRDLPVGPARTRSCTRGQAGRDRSDASREVHSLLPPALPRIGNSKGPYNTLTFNILISLNINNGIGRQIFGRQHRLSPLPEDDQPRSLRDRSR